jgi:hypothetical protein
MSWAGGREQSVGDCYDGEGPAPERKGSRVTKLQYTREARRTLAPLNGSAVTQGASSVPKRNYGFEKRQKELNKQRKQEEKRQRRQERAEAPAENVTIEEGTSPHPPLEE